MRGLRPRGVPPPAVAPESDASLTVLVNSTDTYEDTWAPFFKLFHLFWPNCPYPIVLNTETKTFAFPGLAIRCTRTALAKSDSRPPAGECLLRCLDQVDTDLVLYLQDDYFLCGRVDDQAVRYLARLMQDENIACIRLYECATSGPWRKRTPHEILWEVHRKADYRISLQAALWRKTALSRYIDPAWSIWEIERRGTERAYRTRDRIYCVARDRFMEKGRYVVPYRPTGIVRGQWNAEVVLDLFEANGIHLDYTKRGFYRHKSGSQACLAMRRRLRWTLVRVGLYWLARPLDSAIGLLQHAASQTTQVLQSRCNRC